MKVIKVKPYIIKKIDNHLELEKIQDELYDDGYYFLGDKISNEMIQMFSKYPQYISNLPFSDDNERTQIKRRKLLSQQSNCVLWICENKYEFDLSKLRYEKLCILNNHG